MRATRGRGCCAGAACAGAAGCWACAMGIVNATDAAAAMLTNPAMRVTFMEEYSLLQGDRPRPRRVFFLRLACSSQVCMMVLALIHRKTTTCALSVWLL